MTAKSRRAPSQAARDAYAQLAAVAPEAAAALGDSFTLAEVQAATLEALSQAKAQPPALVALNVRIDAGLKARAAEAARSRGITLQALVTEALEAYLAD